MTSPDTAALVSRLRENYTTWNHPPSECLPDGAGVMLEAADALASQAATIRQMREAGQALLEAIDNELDTDESTAAFLGRVSRLRAALNGGAK